MQKLSLKIIVMLLGLLMPVIHCQARSIKLTDGFSHINIKEAQVQSVPKGSSIQASISGHYLTVVFTENLGEVAIEITSATGMPVEYFNMTTPNGYQFYITNTGDYIITFTLPNGDEYYGEFTVTE